jgi:NADPH2:quinone reductase
MNMRALRVYHGSAALLETIPAPSPSSGEVVILSQYSSINYKDALAITGQGKILRSFPMTPGIDVSGVIHSSNDNRFKAGDRVLVTGFGLGEHFDGGYAEQVKVHADFIVPCPDGLTLREAMMIGTAGFTAALAIHRMEENHQTPSAGPIAVTGATGGVGSMAINMLAQCGYQVTAISGKSAKSDYLTTLGANEILSRDQFKPGSHPLEQARWAGAIDNVGGETLADLTRIIKPHGNIASIGLAGGHTLHTTVMPFILRGINLLGIDSVNCPMPLRKELWNRLANKLKPQALSTIGRSELSMEDIPSYCKDMLSGNTSGRAIIKY